MNIRFLTIAETEVDEAVSWYQKKSQVESLKFLDELDRVVRLVAGYPLIELRLIRRFVVFCLAAFPIL